MANPAQGGGGGAPTAPALHPYYADTATQFMQQVNDSIQQGNWQTLEDRLKDIMAENEHPGLFVLVKRGVTMNILVTQGRAMAIEYFNAQVAPLAPVQSQFTVHSHLRDLIMMARNDLNLELNIGPDPVHIRDYLDLHFSENSGHGRQGVSRIWKFAKLVARSEDNRIVTYRCLACHQQMDARIAHFKKEVSNHLTIICCNASINVREKLNQENPAVPVPPPTQITPEMLNPEALMIPNDEIPQEMVNPEGDMILDDVVPQMIPDPNAELEVIPQHNPGAAQILNPDVIAHEGDMILDDVIPQMTPDPNAEVEVIPQHNPGAAQILNPDVIAHEEVPAAGNPLGQAGVGMGGNIPAAAAMQLPADGNPFYQAGAGMGANIPGAGMGIDVVAIPRTATFVRITLIFDNLMTAFFSLTISAFAQTPQGQSIHTCLDTVCAYYSLIQHDLATQMPGIGVDSVLMPRALSLMRMNGIFQQMTTALLALTSPEFAQFVQTAQAQNISICIDVMRGYCMQIQSDLAGEMPGVQAVNHDGGDNIGMGAAAQVIP